METELWMMVLLCLLVVLFEHSLAVPLDSSSKALLQKVAPRLDQIYAEIWKGRHIVINGIEWFLS